MAEDGSYCPYFHHTIELIGRRWTGAVLLAMAAGRSNYSDIRDAIPGISDRLLSERLRELEVEGIVRPETDAQLEPAIAERAHPSDLRLPATRGYPARIGGNRPASPP